ncbi:MAG: hypothetical protein SYC29_00245 [Planctomycetota bacterium]|nr:hypothetical protein [Planctomycetota bacterium]
MSNQTSIPERFNRLPRAIRWLVLAVAFVVLFQLWFYLLWPVVDRCNVAAAEIERQAAAVREGSELVRRVRRMDDVVCAIGPVSLPGNENEASDALTAAYVDVMNRYSVGNDSFDLRGAGGPVSNPHARGLVSPGHQLRRVTARFVFEASPEDAIAIIGDLESRPDIEALTEIKLLRIGGRRVKVTLGLEAWAQVARSR